MPKEVISIHLGQAGVQLGNSCWELFCIEHGIQPDGKISDNNNMGGIVNEYHTFFSENENGGQVARAVFIDSETTAIDKIRTCTYNRLLQPDQLISGKEDAANNFARGRYSVSKQTLNICLDKIRKLTEGCSNFQGFLIFNSVGGGTGSGLGSLLLEKLSAEYQKKAKLGLIVYPSPKISSAMVEPYNTILSNHYLIQHTDLAVVLDNEALYDICQRHLDIQKPVYQNLNEILAQFISSMTFSLRFESGLNFNLDEFQVNLIPVPRLHFMLSSYAPIYSWQKSFITCSVKDITHQAYDPMYMLAKCDPSQGKYLASCLVYRGDIIPKDVGFAWKEVRAKRIINFVDCLPPSCRFGIHYLNSMPLQGGQLAEVTRSAYMICNSTSIVEVFSRFNHKFDLMYKNRVFIHWYKNEGMEENEFSEAREDLESLQKSYQEVAMDNIEAEGEEGD